MWTTLFLIVIWQLNLFIKVGRGVFVGWLGAGYLLLLIHHGFIGVRRS